LSKEVYAFPVFDWHNPVLVRSDIERIKFLVLDIFPDGEKE
jgi:hypothetical protein